MDDFSSNSLLYKVSTV
jgi:hypothetical protein